ncbi:hypothetical protein FHW79_001673 [Azospirillum sp. OGB3]|uniref:hypothetical protein n=1 Tax=Azospirillum sp. OGB3 TaxID=2587012 RepID=UPI001606D512|nr:hypothetical protein [Azospirillum sp. OGB3]MBB3264058.1 hypothetical protein [Azospirillum sp. OGB3]
MASAAAFRRSLQVFANRTLSPAAQSAHLAQVAKTELAGLVQSGRAPASHRRFVDGREGAPEEAVGPAPSGRIIYRFNHLGAVCTFALSFLVNRSPERTGRFRKGFYLGIDGKFVPMAQFNPAALTADVRQVVIGNIEPYSRKVDVQLVGGEPLSFSVPAGLFEDAVQAIKARFGVLVDVKRVYTMSFPGQYILQTEQHHRSGRYQGRSRKRAGKPVESPAIIITPRR